MFVKKSALKTAHAEIDRLRDELEIVRASLSVHSARLAKVTKEHASIVAELKDKLAAAEAAAVKVVKPRAKKAAAAPVASPEVTE